MLKTSSIALLVWHRAARASRQADETQISGSGHYWRLAPSGRGSFARRYGIAEVLKVQWCLAAWAGVPGGGGEWRLAALWSPPGGDDAVMCDARQAVWT